MSNESDPIVDMSSEALDRRIRESSQLRRLALELAKAKPITEEEAQRLLALRYPNRKEPQPKTGE